MTVDWHGDEVLRQIERALRRGEQAAAEELLEQSNARVPVETGRLRGSGRVEDGQVIYDAPYAAVVHERMDVHHDVGEAKFLESAANGHKQQLAEKLAAEIRRVTR